MFRKKDDESFMTWVELHERAWGTDTYYGRPSLEAIITSPVVIFWYPNKRREERHMITLHADLRAVHEHIARMILRSRIQLPDKRLARLFVQGRQVRIKGIKLLLEHVDAKE